MIMLKKYTESEFFCIETDGGIWNVETGFIWLFLTWLHCENRPRVSVGKWEMKTVIVLFLLSEGKTLEVIILVPSWVKGLFSNTRNIYSAPSEKWQDTEWIY